MTGLAGKKILITSGGTLEKWDEVRGHTNLARGVIGGYLAEEALRQGAEVIYLHGFFAAVPPDHPNMRLESFLGIDDLGAKMKSIVTSEPIAAVIMTAAVSDWVVDKICDSEGRLIEAAGKISSDHPPVIHFKKAPKVITEIKNWRSDLLLVGFKLEHEADEDYLLQRARSRMATWRADWTVANASRSLYAEETAHYIVASTGEVEVCHSKQETAVALIHALAARLAQRT